MRLENFIRRVLKELQEINGIGSAKSCQIIALFELNKRHVLSKKPQKFISSAKVVFELMNEKLKDENQENFIAIHLNNRNYLIKEELITKGIVDASIIDAREVFKSAIRNSASRIIIVHNHPSGDPSPSKEDDEITEKLIDAGELLGIKFLDPATGYASGGNVGGSNAGSIYKTMNAGATWTLEATNVNRFYRGSFPSYGAGYVCGLNGTVVKVTNINSGVGIAENNSAHFEFEAFPNPFNNSFSVNLDLKEENEVSMKLYDALGKLCASQTNGILSIGKHQLSFDNLSLTSGTYVLEMKIGDITENKKLIRTE